MPNHHDSAYKDFFSHKQVVVDFLRGYVQQSWVSLLDFDSLERVNSSYVHQSEKQRSDDAVWRLKLKSSGDWVYLYVLLEFQSRVERDMALRMLAYTALLYQDLFKQELIRQGKERLPLVFPVVIYNGHPVWRAPLALRELIAEVPEELQRYVPQMDYFLLDEGRVRHPLTAENTLSTIIQLETAPDSERLAKVLQQAQSLLANPENASLKRALLAWVRGIIMAKIAPGGEIIPELRRQQEADTMLAESVNQWVQEWLQQGKQEGLLEGKLEGKKEGKQEGLLEGKLEGKQEGLLEGKLEGKQEGKLEVVFKMYAEGLTPEDIARFTGLSVEQVQSALAKIN